MKRIIIMRHADASGANNQVSDFDRNLSPMGQMQAIEVGRQLETSQQIPDRILCSSAIRAKETCDFLCNAFATPPSCHYVQQFYLADMRTIIETVTLENRGEDTLMLIGHNPGWSDSIQWLCGQYVSLMPSNAGILKHQENDWPYIIQDKNGWTLEAFIQPR